MRDARIDLQRANVDHKLFWERLSRLSYRGHIWGEANPENCLGIDKKVGRAKKEISLSKKSIYYKQARKVDMPTKTS